MTFTMARIILFFLLFLLFIPRLTSAESKTFIKEYTYHASDEDSKNSSRILALREVERLLLEELRTYLENVSEVEDFQPTKDQITTLTAGIVKTEIVDEQWDGRTYWLKSKITVDSGEVIKSINALRKDRVKTKELEEIRKRSDELLKENEKLRKELATAKSKQKQEATMAYNKTITDINAIDWVKKGNALGKSWKWQDAKEAFTKAIELDPKYAQAYRERGTSYYILGDRQQAIIDYDRAIELDPIYASTYYMRGLVYNVLKEYNKAIRDLDMAIMLNSKDKSAYMERGEIYISLGNYQQGFKDIDKAIELEPEDWQAYYRRGGAYDKLGNYKRAVVNYDRAIELAPLFSEAYYARAVSLYYLGNHRQAIQDFDTVIKLDPMHIEAYDARGRAFNGLGQYQQAIKNYDKVIEFDQKHAVAYHNRGVASSNLGNSKQAFEDFKTAARLGLKESQDLLRSNGVSW